MQPLIDAEHQIVGLLALLDDTDVLDDPPLAILAHLAFGRHAGEPLVEAAFDPFDAGAVDVGHADDVGADLTGRVVTARLTA